MFQIVLLAQPQAPKPLQPTNRLLDFPAAAIAPQRTPVLRRHPPGAPMRSDHLDYGLFFAGRKEGRQTGKPVFFKLWVQ